MEIKNTPILVIGDTGTGKSTLIENLPHNRTMILNTEDKVLPFENAHEYANRYVTSYKGLLSKFEALIKDNCNTIDYVCIDSLSAVCDIIQKYAMFQFNGYEVWAQYNEMISVVLTKIKQLPQKVLVIALPEQKDESFGETKTYARVKGKEWKYGNIEKEFTVVLFTNPEYADKDMETYVNANGKTLMDVESGDMTECYLKYKPNKKSSSKSPPGMFKGKVPNDISKVFKAVDTFHGREA